LAPFVRVKFHIEIISASVAPALAPVYLLAWLLSSFRCLAVARSNSFHRGGRSFKTGLNISKRNIVIVYSLRVAVAVSCWRPEFCVWVVDADSVDALALKIHFRWL